MLTYKIQTPTAARDRLTPETKQQILSRNLSATIFKVGDRVRFKKPRRNPVYALVVGIQDNVSEITWSSNETPMNIILEVERKNGHQERMKTNVKKLVLVSMGTGK